MAQDRTNSDQLFLGNVHITKLLTVSVPFLDNDGVKINAAIAASKLQHRHALAFTQEDGIDVVTETRQVHLTKGSGTVQLIQIFPTVAPAGGTSLYTIDVEKSSGGGAFASILVGPITVDNTAVDRTEINAPLATPGLVTGDALRVVLTVTAGTGTQGQGVNVQINADENAV